MVCRLNETHCRVAQVVEFQDSVEGKSELESLPELLDGSTVKRQKKLTVHVSNSFFQELFQLGSTEERVRLDSCGTEGGSLVTTLPRYDYFCMESEHYVERICSRLGLQINFITSQALCGQCKTTVADVFGYHIMSGCYSKGNRRFKTHDNVRDT